MPEELNVAYTSRRLSQTHTQGVLHMYAAVRSATLQGTMGSPIMVEAHVGPGLPSFTVVGLPDEGCRESRDRVRAAMLSSGFDWPMKRITINLVGSGERKGGAAMDLAIAIGLLVATDVIDSEAIEKCAFVAELGLDGSLRPSPGMAPLVAAVTDHEVVIAAGSVGEAMLARPSVVRPVRHLSELVDALMAEAPWPTHNVPEPVAVLDDIPDLADVRGQKNARLALEVAAAGFHHLLMVGPPGAGKSMLARRLPGLLPRLTEEEAFTCAMVRSAAGLPALQAVATSPPFRSPHHSITMAAMVGGGSATVRPGELTLASNGVLFLDEMGEFAPTVLDALRQPLEEGMVHVSRVGSSVSMPARCLLVGASNPCPCGGESGRGRCNCQAPAKVRYFRRFSGPILDRFDLRVELLRPTTEELTGGVPGEPSASVAERVRRVHRVSLERQGCLNSAISADMLEAVAPLSSDAMDWLRTRLDAGRLSARGYHRVRRVARTLADIHNEYEDISVQWVQMADRMRVDVFPEIGVAS